MKNGYQASIGRAIDLLGNRSDLPVHDSLHLSTGRYPALGGGRPGQADCQDQEKDEVANSH